jgi:hypothetical protein
MQALRVAAVSGGGYWVPQDIAAFVAMRNAEISAQWIAHQPKPARRALWLEDLQHRNAIALRLIVARVRALRFGVLK